MSSDKELEEQLTVAGTKLVQPPSSLEQLLLLLDQVESSLSKVEQSPAKSMHDALSPVMKALVANNLLRHADIDVKVAVASCISEITRITAPDAPYDDDKMKDVFQLIVNSFENLHDQSSRSFNKRVLILETVAKVRSCVVMLDLECDRLITEMFQLFLKAIREDHPENIFSSMVTIMTLVLEESEEVSLELLTPLLASVKKDNEVTPIAKKLGETVFEKCAEKLKPYLAQAVESLQISLDEYNKIVTSVLEWTPTAVNHINDSAPKDLSAAESKLADLPGAAQATQVDGSKVAATASSDEGGQMAESLKEEACSEDVDPTVNRSPKSITSNGVSLENVGSAAETESSMKAEDHDKADLLDDAKIPSKSESDDSSAGKPTKSESKSELTAKKRGRRTNSSTNSAESSHQSPDDGEKETEKLPDYQRSLNEDDQSSASEDPVVEQPNSLEKEPESTLQHSVPKESEGEAVNVAPSSPSQSLRDESAPKKGRRTKRERINQEESASKKESEATSDLEIKQVRRPLKKTPLEPSHKEENKGGRPKKESLNQEESASKKESEATSDLEVKQVKRPLKKTPLETSHKEENKGGRPKKGSLNQEESAPKKDSEATSDFEVKQVKRPLKKAPLEASLEEENKGGSSSDAEAKKQKQSGKKTDTKNKSQGGSSVRNNKDGKKRGRGKERVPSQESPDDSAKHDEGNEEENQEASAKRKPSSGKGREIVPSSESPDNSAKHESSEEETPKTSAKRKRSLGKDKVTETAKKYGRSLIGSKIKVWWPLDHEFYEGVVEAFDSKQNKHTVNYTDGEVEILNLKNERWEFVVDDQTSEGEQETSADAATEGHQKKKSRNAGPSAKDEKVEASPKSKSKDPAKKSGQKSKYDSKLKFNLKDDTPKSGGRADGTSNSKSKVRSKKSSGKSVVDTEKPPARSKDVGSSASKPTPKQDTPSNAANKSKQETVRAAIKSNNKTPQSGSKPGANGMEKLKSTSSKGKESGNKKDKANDSAKTPDSIRGKLSTASKERESEPKSGKKRARGKS